MFNLINFESNATDLTLVSGKMSDEGIENEDWSNREMLRAPNYAFHSLKNTLSGKAVLNLGASPLGAYGLMAFKGTGIGQVGAIQKGIEYYESPKRNIHSLVDLELLFEYQVWMFLASIAIGLLFKKSFHHRDEV